MKKIFWLFAALMFPLGIWAQSGVAEFEANGVKFRMVAVDGGPFRMSEDLIAVVSSFYIGETEVTQGLWRAVMDSNPSKFEGAQHPVNNVSWEDCQTFIEKLNALTGKQFRLPTEAEWTYAAIGGKRCSGFAYSGSNFLNEVGWWARNPEAFINFAAKKSLKERIAGSVHLSEPQDVAKRKANELGIYDMTGNVWEWCQDWYKSDLPEGQVVNPTGPKKGKLKAFRGGSWKSEEETCQIVYRECGMSSAKYEDVGLRLVLAK